MTCIAGLICAAAAEIGSVAMLTVGQAVYATQTRFAAGKLAVVSRCAPGRGIHGSVRVTSDTVAHCGIETAGAADQIHTGLRHTCGIGTAGVTDGTDIGVSCVCCGVAGTA